MNAVARSNDRFSSDPEEGARVGWALSEADVVGLWQRVRAKLQVEVGETVFNAWIRPISVIGREGDRVILTVPSQFMRDWIVSNLGDRLRCEWGRVDPTVRAIALHILPTHAAPATQTSGEPSPAVGTPPAAEPAGTPSPGGGADPASTLEQQADGELGLLGARLDPRLTFETFVVGKPNEFAVAAAERITSSPTPPFNPLFLYGGVGLGKTHLMHAIAWRVRQLDPSRRIVYLSAEKFMYQFVRALRSKDMMGFKELFRSVDLLMVDDVQFISGKDSTQEEFFHTFNTLVDRGRQIVISADRSPSEMDGLEERIRSRLSWGLVADIHPTTYELRLGILEVKAEQLGAVVSKDVLEFLATRITSNVRELEGALNRIVHQAQLYQRSVTIDMAQDVLRDILRTVEKRITIDDIQRAVVEHFGLKMSDMSSTGRSRAIARPRQVAMYLAKVLTTRSLPEIGRKFGNRDHTTVMHGIRQIEKLSSEDRSLSEDVEALRRRLQL